MMKSTQDLGMGQGRSIWTSIGDSQGHGRPAEEHRNGQGTSSQQPTSAAATFFGPSEAEKRLAYIRNAIMKSQG